MQLDRRTTELDRALERQTATADILKVIASSPSDVQPVFEAIAESAARLCQVEFCNVFRFDGEFIHFMHSYGYSREAIEALRPFYPMRPGRGSCAGRAILNGKVEQVPDVRADPEYTQGNAPDIMKISSIVAVPMLKERRPVGAIALVRAAKGTFPQRQIDLLKTFADQAVIAIENARLFEEVRAKSRDLEESLQQQTATADVLKVISRSAFDLETVTTAILRSAMELCNAPTGLLHLRDDDVFRLKLALGHNQETVAFNLAVPIPLHDALHRRGPVHPGDYGHYEDMWNDPVYRFKKAVKLAGVRAGIVVPMFREDEVIGLFSLARPDPGPFTPSHIRLVQTFADQAAIAIENVRLFNEVQQRTNDLSESLHQQTATADVLKIISRSSVDLETVLKTLVETVARLCRADQVVMWRRRRDNLYHLVAWHGLSEEAREFVLAHPFASGRGTVSGRAALERRSVSISDVLEDPEYTYNDAQKLAGYRSMLAIPLLREDALVGIFSIHRTRVEPFTNKEIELATTFADQAVIAIENARLFDELRERQAELARSVDELTATSDVLKIISRSSVDLENVLDTLVETVARLCRADQTVMFRRLGAHYHPVGSHGLPSEAKKYLYTHPLSPDRGTLSGRVEFERRPVQIDDVLEDPEYSYQEGQKLQGYRTMLGIPLLREDALIGIFVVNRTHVEPFTKQEVELATTFADQAVIAIENARLFDELRDRQAELRVTFDNMGDGVVMFDAAGRLAAWNRNLQEMIELPEAFLTGRPNRTEYFRYLADRGEFSADLEAQLGRTVDDTGLELRYERMRPDGRVVEVRRNPVPGGGFVLIYSDITQRKRAEEAIRAAKDAAESALRELQTAQASLVHAQKMAALGQVTAGIAHEIKNPLNFVNNFAGLSVELLDELKEAARAVGALDPGKRTEIVETIGMLTGNLEKIVEHGRRADGIVRSMLQHSRGGSDDWQAADLNALVEEALNLAYHGARAQDPNFDVTVERDLDFNLASVDVVPQELTRVLLNLIGNAFYAANRRSREGDGTYRPALKITTRDFGESVEVRVRDNGTGIPPENRDKLFQPFFTTKPTGEGTGLGLSISYEIVTQQHGGTITVDSEFGDFTEFAVRLPRRPRAAGGAG